MLLHEASHCGGADRIARERRRRLERNEEARYYHYKKRNHLPPLRVSPKLD